MYDTDPIQVGHLLIISKGHFMNIAELPFPLLQEVDPSRTTAYQKEIERSWQMS